MRSPLKYLSTRLFLVLLVPMLIVFTLHAYSDVQTNSSILTEYVYQSADRASDLIARSTRYSMLLNRKDDVHQTINTLGSQPGFVGINIYNKAGEIIFSTDSLLIGHKVDLDAEACNICHASDAPLVSVPTASRMRVYESTEGHLLGLINPIRNEPECYNAACHAHPADQNVLGVLDVKMSLASVDAQVAKGRSALVYSSLLMTLVVAGMSGLFIYRVIRRPIRKLKDGMVNVSRGDLSATIEMKSDTEIGDLAQSFNNMASDLKRARSEVQDWGETLEHRIEKKTEELQQAQSQIIQMEKMSSLGKLSASVAHEINNPIFGILTYAKLLLRELEEGHVDDEVIPTLRKHLGVIHEESSRCGDIVKNLLDFARRSGGDFGRHHLNEIVEQTVVLLQHHFEMRQIEVTSELMSDDDRLLCDAKQIKQAIVAPCINAVEAMPSGGPLTIRTYGDHDTVSVQIIDTGVGIPEEVVPKIFEPFYSTKEGEAGVGLGLAVAYGIVRRHQGRIDVDSTPDKGTTLTITLPREPSIVDAELDGVMTGDGTDSPPKHT